MREPPKAAVTVRSADLEPSKDGDLLPQFQLIQTLVLRLLVLDVFSDHRLVSPHGRDEVPSCPKMLAHEVSLSPAVLAGNMNRALTLDVTHDLRHRVFRRNREHHMDVIRHHMPLLDLAFFLPRKFAKHRPDLPPQRLEKRLPPAFRDEHDVILALPFGMALTLIVVHGLDSLPFALGGSRKGVRVRLPELSNFGCLPGRAGGSPAYASPESGPQARRPRTA